MRREMQLRRRTLIRRLAKFRARPASGRLFLACVLWTAIGCDQPPAANATKTAAARPSRSRPEAGVKFQSPSAARRGARPPAAGDGPGQPGLDAPVAALPVLSGAPQFRLTD